MPFVAHDEVTPPLPLMTKSIEHPEVTAARTPIIFEVTHDVGLHAVPENML
jgi:hypothetical protein